MNALELEDRLIDYAVSVCRIAEHLPQTGLGRHIRRQIIRSGTAAAPNYGEAQSAESRRDFVHKLRIVLKELHETRVWLKLMSRHGILPSSKLRKCVVESNELIAIFVASIRTTRANDTRSAQPASG